MDARECHGYRFLCLNDSQGVWLKDHAGDPQGHWRETRDQGIQVLRREYASRFRRCRDCRMEGDLLPNWRRKKKRKEKIN